MNADTRAGRPRASSRATLAEAASELFLERGFAATTVADITTRAGVSRSSFFNYFASKSAVLWGELDERIAALEAGLRAPQARVEPAVRAMVAGFAPDSLALAIVNADAMGLADDLEREASLRRGRVARAVAAVLVRDGRDPLVADVLAAGWAGALTAALWAWARAGAGRVRLDDQLDRAIAVVVAGDSGTLP